MEDAPRREIPRPHGIPRSATRDLMTYTDDTKSDDHESRTRNTATITTYSFKKDGNLGIHHNISKVRHFKTIIAVQ